jgi:23S rRNA (uracil1939-C5)-methyltransferase
MKKPRWNQKVNLTIKNLGINGEGVGYWHGYTMFVDGALPGEVVEARVSEVSRRFGRGRLTKLVVSSTIRVEPSCPYFSQCGGCQIMHIGYSDQLKLKHNRVVESFITKGGMNHVPIEPCHPSPQEFGYRNKTQFPIVNSIDGIKIGMFARNSHDLVDIDHCLVNCELGERVYHKVCDILKKSEISVYNSETGEGILRFVLIKAAVHREEVLVTLITSFCPPETLEKIAHDIMESDHSIKGVVQNINCGKDNVVLGDEFLVVKGVPFIFETLLGLSFKISPASFFQVNPRQAEHLYSKAIEFAELKVNDSVLDAFCGVGTLTLLLAKKSKEVVGVECVPEAIVDAEENAKINQITNVQFICANAEDWINQSKQIDIAFINPPRKGCEESFLFALGKLSPSKIIYISCDPNTLARDSRILVSCGYSIKTVQPFDMFPQTVHVECVALFEKH